MCLPVDGRLALDMKSENVAEYTETGIDIMSPEYLTHSAKISNLNLEKTI